MRIDRHFRSRTVTRAFFLVLAAAAPASELSVLRADTVMPSIDSVYGRQLSPSQTVDQYVRSLKTRFDREDNDGDGQLTAADVQMSVRSLAANERARQMQELWRKDLDGDGILTTAELHQFYRKEHRRFSSGDVDLSVQAQEEFAVQGDLAADANHDGRITLQESYRFLASRDGAAPVKDPPTAMFAPAMADGGAVNWESVRAIATAFFTTVDSNRDGVLSAAEIASARGAPVAIVPEESPMTPVAQPAGCTLPAPSGGAQILLLSAYEGQGLSTATIGSQDVDVTTATVAVAPGAQPLYVVLTSLKPVIWRFTGAVGRVERVALTSETTGPNGSAPNSAPLSGATGIASAKVSFLRRTECLRYFSDLPSIRATTTRAALTTMLGRKVDVVAARYAVSSFDLPAGEAHSTGGPGGLVVRKSAGTVLLGDNVTLVTGAARELAYDIARYYPDGVVTIDPAKVVASARAERYGVLPNQAGLQQLMQQGALTASGNEFQIRKKIRFPAQLYGAHAARFLLMKGVPKPDGDPGHSCVVSEETGQALANESNCH